jgi:hypothetical protein
MLDPLIYDSNGQPHERIKKWGIVGLAVLAMDVQDRLAERSDNPKVKEETFQKIMLLGQALGMEIKWDDDGLEQFINAIWKLVGEARRILTSNLEASLEAHGGMPPALRKIVTDLAAEGHKVTIISKSK